MELTLILLFRFLFSENCSNEILKFVSWLLPILNDKETSQKVALKFLKSVKKRFLILKNSFIHSSIETKVYLL